MYPWIPWKLVMDLLGSTEHTLETVVLEESAVSIFTFLYSEDGGNRVH